ncbi:MAG: alpha/beta hydrolase [Pseudomonadota bacterium]
MMRSLRRGVAIAAAAAGLLWVGACVALLLARHDIIYAFVDGYDASRAPPGLTVTRIPAADGTPLLIWVSPPEMGQPTILYFTGNGGYLRSARTRLRALAEAGFGVVAMNYRGAGSMPGTPSEPAIISDAEVVYDWVRETYPGPLPGLFGSSLGAAVAVQVAARREVSAVVLEAPFARLCEVGEVHYAYVPVCFILPDNRWASVDRIAEIDAPLLVLHGGADQVIPISQAEKLFEAGREPKRFNRYPRGGHDDLERRGAVRDLVEWLQAPGSG